MAACFMVELCNEREVDEEVRGCDKRHAADEPCNDLEVSIRKDKRWDLRRTDSGEIVAVDVHYLGQKAPVGAMWWEDYSEPHLPAGPQDWAHLDSAQTARVQNPDGSMPDRRPSFIFAPGLQLCVKTPGGRWVIDSRASNCGSPWDYDHRCWIRHGEPPAIHVDKAGATCSAGAGSIQCGTYHGFLHNGQLTDC